MAHQVLPSIWKAWNCQPVQCNVILPLFNPLSIGFPEIPETFLFRPLQTVTPSIGFTEIALTQKGDVEELNLIHL